MPIIPILFTMPPILLRAAVQYACKKLYHSIDRPNMNLRHLSESLDDKIMGDVATIAVAQYCRSINLPSIIYDQIRQDNFQLHDPGWDVVIGPAVNQWARETNDVMSPPDNLITLSVRSSRIPLGRTLQQSIQTCDFKIFAPDRSRIENDITANIEVQVYYEYDKTQLGNLSTTQNSIAQCIENRENCNQVLEDLNILGRFDTCYLVAWATKEDIINNLQSMARRYWNSRHAGSDKRMWIAPLRNGRSIHELRELYPE